MSDRSSVAEKIFWNTPELVEIVLPHLDDYSILCLAQAKLFPLSPYPTHTHTHPLSSLTIPHTLPHTGKTIHNFNIINICLCYQSHHLCYCSTLCLIDAIIIRIFTTGTVTVVRDGKCNHLHHTQYPFYHCTG